MFKFSFIIKHWHLLSRLFLMKFLFFCLCSFFIPPLLCLCSECPIPLICPVFGPLSCCFHFVLFPSLFCLSAAFITPFLCLQSVFIWLLSAILPFLCLNLTFFLSSFCLCSGLCCFFVHSISTHTLLRRKKQSNNFVT